MSQVVSHTADVSSFSNLAVVNKAFCNTLKSPNYEAHKVKLRTKAALKAFWTEYADRNVDWVTFMLSFFIASTSDRAEPSEDLSQIVKLQAESWARAEFWHEEKERIIDLFNRFSQMPKPLPAASEAIIHYANKAKLDELIEKWEKSTKHKRRFEIAAFVLSAARAATYETRMRIRASLLKLADCFSLGVLKGTPLDFLVEHHELTVLLCQKELALLSAEARRKKAEGVPTIEIARYTWTEILKILESLAKSKIEELLKT
jgi:hypothetical protein